MLLKKKVETKSNTKLIKRHLKEKKRLIVTLAFFFYYTFVITGVVNGSGRLNPEAESNTKGYFTEYLKVEGFFNGEIIKSGSVSDNGIELVQCIKKTDNPWFYRFAIILKNRSGEDFKASKGDSLLIHLGPLPGKDSIKCFLSVASKKRNIEAVALVDNDVIIHQPQLNQSFDLPWPEKKRSWSAIS